MTKRSHKDAELDTVLRNKEVCTDGPRSSLFADDTWRSLSIIGRANYDVSCIGQVRNRSTGKELRQHTNSHGYNCITITSHTDAGRKTWLTHRLVAAAFLPPDDRRTEVNHKNKNRVDNSVDNLEWVCRKENIPLSFGVSKPNTWRAVQSLKNDVVMSQYQSVKAASVDTGIASPNIIWACQHPAATCGGLHWQYTPVSDISNEKWKWLSDPVVHISSMGRVKKASGVITNGYISGKYRKISIGNKSFYVHRLVAMAFIGAAPNGKTVDHIDQNPLNNVASNLRYATNREQGLNQTSATVRPVQQFTKNGIFICEYKNATEAGLSTNFDKSHISAVCRGTRLSARGFCWKYKPVND